MSGLSCLIYNCLHLKILGNSFEINSKTENMSGAVKIRLASERVDHCVAEADDVPRLFTPGEIVTKQQGFMRGHGTYMEEDCLKASVAGVMEQVNKLICVRPLKCRYMGEIGDVIVGRIIEVQQRRWKVDTNSRLDAILLLSSVNLPGGELRRRGVEDEQSMRRYLKEGDLISAEVQSIYSDGALCLHTRSLKYGKLSHGILVKVFPSLVRRWKTHFHSLPYGVSLVIGNNGYIWIYPTTETDAQGGGFAQNLEQKIPQADREVMARIKNCIHSLAASKIMLYDTTILYAYEESLKYENAKDLLAPEAMLDVAFMTQHRMSMLQE